MARKRKGPRVIEDTTDTLFKFPCSNVKCGYQIEKPGRWFDKQDHFICPDCGHYTALDYETVSRMKSDHVKRLSEFLEGLRREPGDK